MFIEQNDDYSKKTTFEHEENGKQESSPLEENNLSELDLVLSKSKSENNMLEEEITDFKERPGYKIKRSNGFDEKVNDKLNFDTSLSKNKFVDPELWRQLQNILNNKKVNIFAERIKKYIPEKEASYLIDKLLKNEN